MSRKFLFTITLCFFMGCQRNDNWRESAGPMEFEIPPSFEGAVLIVGQGRRQVFDNLLIMVDDLDQIGMLRNVRSNRFMRGENILIENPVASLYLPNTDLSEFTVWGKRYTELLPSSPAGLAANELGCGYEFAVYFVGNGVDAKHFFDNSAAVAELILKYHDENNVDEQ